jgi:hypothetical protein
MPNIAPFEAHAQRYEAWFDQHEAAHLSGLLTVRPFLTWSGCGIEIGVGTGRFAAPLGIQVGLDPSPTIPARAAERGIDVVEGTADGAIVVASAWKAPTLRVAS